MSFLSVFTNILHAAEVAASIAAPIIQTMDPQIGFLMSAATQAAVGIEGSIQMPGQGALKAQVVQQQTQASIDAVNAILLSQGKKPLPPATGQMISTQVGVVVGNMNAIEQAVKAAPPAQAQSQTQTPTAAAPPPPPPVASPASPAAAAAHAK